MPLLLQVSRPRAALCCANQRVGCFSRTSANALLLLHKLILNFVVG